MKVHVLEKTSVIPIGIGEAWEFFSSPANLDRLTPPEMAFRILHIPSEKMYEGEIIVYKIRVAPGIWMRWTTEIKAVEEGRSFVDEQRSGPYRFWHHRHTFEEVEGGTKVTDLVHYSLGMWWAGDVAHALFVRKKLERIFGYREKVMGEIFPGR